MANVSKIKEGDGYRVLVDGRRTHLIVKKSTAARFGQHQKWDVIDATLGDDDLGVIFDAKGLESAINAIRRIADLLLVEA